MPWFRDWGDKERNVPYVDKTSQWRAFLLLPLYFGLCYLVNTWVVELRREEALTGTVAREMALSRDFLSTTFQGEYVARFPQYPALVALCSGFGVPTTFTTRLPAALAVLATALVCGWFAGRRGGRAAGIVAGGIVLSSLACLRVGQRAQTETLFMFWLTCSWLAWYVYGQERKRWGLAWSGALFFLFLATTAVGARAVAYFYLPFLFLKRPVRGRQRLLQPYHVVALVGFAVAVVLWLWAAPNQPLMPWNADRLPGARGGSYAWNRALFPLKTVLYLMPWTALAWTPFCVAFRSVERRPVLFHYLRTLVTSLFFLVWLLPWSSPLLLLPVLPALAIMAGCHFEILVRRHRREVERYLLVLGWLGLSVAVVSLALGVCEIFGVIVAVGMSLQAVCWNSVVLIVAAMMAAFSLRSSRNGGQPYWLRFMVALCALRLVVAAVHPLVEAWGGNERREVADVLTGRMHAGDLHGGQGPMYGRGPLPEMAVASAPGQGRDAPPPPQNWGLPADASVVYVHRPPAKAGTPAVSRPALITESFYLGRCVQRVKDLEEDLPREVQSVYVLGGENPPILASRAWTPASPVMDSRRRNTFALSWFPSTWCILRVHVVPRGDSRAPNKVRLYRGDLR